MLSWVRQIKLVHIFQIIYGSWNPAVLGWKEPTTDLSSIGQIFQPKEKSKHLLYDILKKTMYCWDIKNPPTLLKRIKKRKIKVESMNCKAFIGTELILSVTQGGQGFSFANTQKGVLCIHLQWYCLCLLWLSQQSPAETQPGSVCSERRTWSSLPVYAGKSQNWNILNVLSEPVPSAWGDKKKKQGKLYIYICYKVWEFHVHGQAELSAPWRALRICAG